MELAAADGAIFVRVKLAHEIVHVSVQVVHVRAGHIDGKPEQQRPQLGCVQQATRIGMLPGERLSQRTMAAVQPHAGAALLYDGGDWVSARPSRA